MSQTIFTSINPATTSGNQLATILNNFKDAVVSGLSGTSRPSALQAGGYWVDTTLAPNYWEVKLYTGSVDVTLFTINLSTGVASITSTESVLELNKNSDDSVGGILKFVKERATGNQTQDGDTLGEIDFNGTRSDDTKSIMAKIKAVATDSVTALAQGSYLSFEVTPDATAAAVELMRLIDSKVGIGTVSPEETLHVKGHGKIERASDDSVGAKIVRRKKRVTGSGQVQSGDKIATEIFTSTDNTGAEVEVATIEVAATENHTTTAQGSSLIVKTKDNGSAAYTTKITVDNSGVDIPVLKMSGSDVQSKAEKGAASGYCPLNSSTKIDTIYLPSYVDDVVEYANLAAFPVTGSTGLIYVALDTNKTYRWTGSAYVEISPSDVNSVNGYTGIVVLAKGDVGLGNVDNTSDATKNAAAATLTNKTIIGANIQTPTRLDVKQDTESNLTTYATTASNGQIVFATDTKAMYQVVDTELTPIGGGGGGGSLIWKKTGTTSPVAEIIDGMELESFDSTNTMEIYAVLAVPSSYRAGKQIKLKNGKFFCASTTGKVFFKTVATLINSSTVLGTYSNTRTSSNTEVTVSGVANTINSIGDLDLTDSTGKINGVSVAAGDKIRVRLYRDNASESASASEDARLLVDAFELTLS